MGCLKLIVKIIILILAFIGIQSICKFNLFNVKEKTDLKTVNALKQVADFSQLSDEYKINNTLKLGKNNFVLATHAGSDQKFVLIKTHNKKGKKIFLEEDDFKSDKIDSKINEFLKNTNQCFIHFDNFKVTKKGTMQAFDSNLNFVAFQGHVVNFPLKDIEGIISSKKISDEDTLVLLSLNDKTKFSHIIAFDFFKNLKMIQLEKNI